MSGEAENAEMATLEEGRVYQQGRGQLTEQVAAVRPTLLKKPVFIELLPLHIISERLVTPRPTKACGRVRPSSLS